MDIREPRDRSAEAILAAWRGLPRVDLAELRRDLDAIVDPALPWSAQD